MALQRPHVAGLHRVGDGRLRQWPAPTTRRGHLAVSPCTTRSALGRRTSTGSSISPNTTGRCCCRCSRSTATSTRNYLGAINRLARIDRHRRLLTSTAYLAEIEPVTQVPQGCEVSLQWGQRVLVDGYAQIARITVTPWSDDTEVIVNPRIRHRPGRRRVGGLAILGADAVQRATEADRGLLVSGDRRLRVRLHRIEPQVGGAHRHVPGRVRSAWPVPAHRCRTTSRGHVGTCRGRTAELSRPLPRQRLSDRIRPPAVADRRVRLPVPRTIHQPVAQRLTRSHVLPSAHTDDASTTRHEHSGSARRLIRTGRASLPTAAICR